MIKKNTLLLLIFFTITLQGQQERYTIKNLEWSTHSKNIRQSFKDNPGRVCGGKNRKVKATHKNGSIIYFNSVRECSRHLKRDSSAVTRCCQGEWGYCNNYKLEYYDNETI